MIVNSKKDISGALTYDADCIAAGFRLSTANTVMFGILVGLSGVVSSDEAVEAIKDYMPAKIQERNINALLKAVQEVAE